MLQRPSGIAVGILVFCQLTWTIGTSRAQPPEPPQGQQKGTGSAKSIQNKSAPNKKSAQGPAVEILKLSTGEELRGLSLGSTSAQRAWFLTQRNWLKQSNPALSEKILKEEGPRLEAIRNDLSSRIETWMGELGPEQEGLKKFLKEEQKRFQEKDQPASSQLLLLPINPRQVAKFEARAPLVKNLVLLALQERVEGLETRTSSELAKDLVSLGLDPTKDRANILDRLPPMPIEDPVDWSARKALFAYQMGKPLLLQGSGDVLIDAGKKDANNGAEALMVQLIPKMLQKILGELTGEGGGQTADNWIPTAVTMAESSKAIVARVTRVEPDLVNRKIKVEDYLLARGDNGKWGIVWQMQYVGDGTTPRPQSEAVIKSDPQIAPLLKTAGLLGLNAKIDEAIRFGAATMDLQQQAEKNFGQFLKVATKRLDGVPLKWLLDK